jgi:hypothetical protein
VQNCTEYLVFPHHLEALAREYGLDLLEQGGFHEIVYRALREDPSRVIQQFKTFKIPRHMPVHAWEVSQLYRAFIFEKRATPPRRCSPDKRKR